MVGIYAMAYICVIKVINHKQNLIKMNTYKNAEFTGKLPKMVKVVTNDRLALYFKGNPSYKKIQEWIDSNSEYAGKKIGKHNGKIQEENSVFIDIDKNICYIVNED